MLLLPVSSLLLLSSVLTTAAVAAASYRPVVVWHGLGDSHNSEGMLSVKEDIEDLYPGIRVHLVYIDEDGSKDRNAGFFGNVNSQVELVAQQLKDIPELEKGFDAIGFSQGGQFLRAYVELFNSPPVNNLITFGSQHMGVSGLPPCSPNDFICKIASSRARASVYTHWAQTNLVQAQYFRDPDRLDKYLETNTFLAKINNEPSPHSSVPKTSLSALTGTLLLLRFTNETTVVPAISSWFGSLAPSSSDSSSFPAQEADPEEIPMDRQPLYLEDWIGLRALDERGDVERRWCKGQHMQIGGCWDEVLAEFIGGVVGQEQEEAEEAAATMNDGQQQQRLTVQATGGH